MTLSFPIILALASVVSYMIGSIPFAVIAGRLSRGLDIREHGSGNAGATNAFRVLGWKVAAPVLITDLLKGFLPVLSVPYLTEGLSGNEILLAQIIVLASVVLGHALPLWAGFRGGKGVASAAGGITALSPIVAPFCLLIFIIVLATTRIVSVSSLAAAWMLPTAYLLLSSFTDISFSSWLLGFFMLTTLGITFLHRKNIRKLIKGEEPRIGPGR